MPQQNFQEYLMNNLIKETLAKRYAHAFINTYPCTITQEIQASLQQLYQYLQAKKSILTAADLFAYSTYERTMISKECSRKTSTNEWPLEKLFALLFINRRLTLFAHVILHIEKILLAQQNIIAVTIESSHRLLSNEKDIVLTFFANKTNCHPQPSFILNSNLIAGVRLSSPTFLWEKSIAKHLHELSLALAQ